MLKRCCIIQMILRTSAAKCHEHHVTITNENREHIRDMAWCSLLILNESASGHAERDMRMAWVQRDSLTELNGGANIIVTFSGCEQCCQMHQHSWLKRSSSQLTYIIVMFRDETQKVGGPITCYVTFFVAPNSWSLTSSWHFLPMINTTLLGPTCWLSVCFEGLLGKLIKHLSDKVSSFCWLGPLARTTHLPWLSWWSPTENVATK